MDGVAFPEKLAAILIVAVLPVCSNNYSHNTLFNLSKIGNECGNAAGDTFGVDARFWIYCLNASPGKELRRENSPEQRNVMVTLSERINNNCVSISSLINSGFKMKGVRIFSGPAEFGRIYFRVVMTRVANCCSLYGAVACFNHGKRSA